MNILIDICKRSFYLNLFIVVIPIIAYMIHNGSSATVALVWYLLLSLFMPWAYLSFKDSTFELDCHSWHCIQRHFPRCRFIYVVGLANCRQRCGFFSVYVYWCHN